MEKKDYETPALRVIALDCSTVISASVTTPDVFTRKQEIIFEEDYVEDEERQSRFGYWD